MGEASGRSRARDTVAAAALIPPRFCLFAAVPSGEVSGAASLHEHHGSRLGVEVAFASPTAPSPMSFRLRTRLGAALLLLCLAAPAQAQQTVLPGLEGEALVAALRADYSPATTLGYGPARDSLFAWQDRTTGGLRGAYTGYTVTLTPGADPSADAFSKGISTEHTWPQSRGTSTEPARSDLHHLYPVRDAVNAARSNDPFAEIPDPATDTWYRLDVAQSQQPAVALDEWSERDGFHPDPAYGGRFEPREDHKGDAARAVFYVYAIYGPQLEGDFFEAQQEDLLAWHTADPVSPFEAERADYIADLQGNPNPFLLDSTLARRAFGDGGGGEPPVGGTGDLLISEYVEGSSFNKAVELYNPTADPVDLGAAGYRLEVYFNGSTTAGTTLSLLGVVAPGDVFVVAASNADPAILAVADLTTGAPLFNGNDAVVLSRDDGMGAREVADAFGQVGSDPGDEWGSGLTSTKDNTLRRMADACAGDTDTGDAFDPAVLYVGFPSNTFDDLGMASLDCTPATSPVAVDIEAAGSTTLPASGGTITYTVTLTNTTGEAQTVTARVDAALPDGSSFGPLQGPQTVTLQPNQTLGPISFTSAVPAAAPSGEYTLTLSLDDGASDAFTFTKAASGPALLAGGAEVAAYPNPFAAETTIRFSTEAATRVRLAVYDALGREVAVLADGVAQAGRHEARLDGRGLPPGVYLWHLAAGDEVRTGRLTLLR